MAERGQLTSEQVRVLLQPIRPQRVYQAQGQSHVAAWDVTAHLSRVFGFDGWDKEILSLDMVSERMDPEAPGGRGKPNRPGWWITYRCLMRLTIRDPQGRVVKVIEEAATGSAQNMPSPGDAHDFACKNAVSYALKRCAKDLGDQFGLSLYDGGRRNAVVGKTLVPRSELEALIGDGPADAPTVDDHVEQVEGEGEEPSESVGAVEQQDTSPSPAVPAPAPDLRRVVEAARAQMTAAQKSAVREFMAVNDIPSLARATAPQLEQLADECERVLNGAAA